MKESRSFLVVGAASELGRSLSAQLAEHGPVVGVRRLDDPVRAEDEALHCADLSHASEVRRVVTGLAYESDVDTVIYLPRSGPVAAELGLLLDALEQQPKIEAFVMASSVLVYRADPTGTALVDERHPVELSPSASSAVRALVEADVLASLRIPSARMHMAVLRLAGVLDREARARRGPVLRALGYDPMVNVLSVQDAACALALAAAMRARGIFNIPGADTLPVSELSHRLRRIGLPVPAPMLARLARSGRASFGLTLGLPRLDHALLLDGRAAKASFGYHPRHPISFHR